MSDTQTRTVIDVYPVGLLASIQQDRRAWRHRDEIRKRGGSLPLQTRQTVRYLLARVRNGEWRAAKNAFNGYLAEPYDFPAAVRRCGSGWTKTRALRSLRRQYERVGLTMPNPDGAPVVAEPPTEPCPDGFRWMGQPFTCCEGCGLPIWEHAGWADNADNNPFSGALKLRPFERGERERLEARWRR